VTAALVTGASSGIGEAFARELAARRHDLVLVARRADRLEEEASRLAAAHGVAVEVLAADLASPDGIAVTAERLSDASRPVDLLVNNAGIGTVGSFWELPVDAELAMIHLNVLALVQLTHAALGPMVERNTGGVINVSSLGAYQPVPFNATYGATKAFVSSFTNAVREELRGTNVRLMVVAPGFTRTEFQETSFEPRALPEFVWQSADEVASTAMRAYDRGRTVCITGAMNVVAAAASSVMPAVVMRRVSGAVTRRVS
jgi:short-subunit dehydrogenase